jgi:hypothetical protein
VGGAWLWSVRFPSGLTAVVVPSVGYLVPGALWPAALRKLRFRAHILAVSLGARVEAQGWYRDPYLVHEDRYFSAGQPTKLVRDGGIEDYDPPPTGPPKTELVEVRHTPANSVGDLCRADDSSAGAVYDPYMAALRGDLIQVRLGQGHRQSPPQRGRGRR